MNDFAWRLKFLREQKDLSLSKLAEDINTTKSALSRYENGKMEPGLKVMIKLSEYFNVSLDWLAGNGEDDDYDKSCINIKHYEDIVNKCIKKDISPEQLNKVVDMIDSIKK